MNLRKIGAATLLTAMFLDLAGSGALADPLPPPPPVPVIVTVDTTPAPSLTTGVTVPSSTITSTTATTVTPSPAAVTTTTNTTVPATTVQVPLPTPTPIVQITTTQPITVGSTTTVSPTTSTPLSGSVTIGGPGTAGSVPIATNISPVGNITVQPQPLPEIEVKAPTVPSVTSSGSAPISTQGTTYDATTTQATATGAIRTFTIDPNTGEVRPTTASATVSEPANGIAVSATTAAAVCLLANAVGRTTLDPTATAYLSTLCGGSASTADATAGATAGKLASGSVGLAASICLVANALAVPSPFVSTPPPVSAYLASAGLDTRCGTGPSTADIDSTATALDNATVAANGAAGACLIASAQAGIPSIAGLDTRCADLAVPGPSTASVGSTTTLLGNSTLDAGSAAAVCVIASALAGVPATADLSTACGAASGSTPSAVTGGVNGTTPLGDLNGDLSAALCVVAHAVADLPTTATLTTACGSLPTQVSGNGGVDLPGAGGSVAPNAATCIAADSTVPGLTLIGQTCGTPGTAVPDSGGTPGTAVPDSGGTPVLGSETGPGRDNGDSGSIDLIPEPAGGVRDEQSAPQGDNSLLAQLGITSLPGTATAIGGGALGLALIGLGVALMRRRRTA